MKADALVNEKRVMDDGSIVQLVVWQLPKQERDRPHGLKYRLYYGDRLGRCLVRYDNESGKGDHKHIGSDEWPYYFVSFEQLLDDFWSDVLLARERQDE